MEPFNLRNRSYGRTRQLIAILTHLGSIVQIGYLERVFHGDQFCKTLQYNG